MIRFTISTLLIAISALLLTSCRMASLSDEWSVAEGNAAPEFSLTDTAGTQRSLSEFSGKVVVLSFFATWCPPCNAEMPELETLWTQKKDSGLVVVAASQGEDTGTVEPFVQEKALTFPVLVDEELKLASLYGGSGLPRTVVIDRTGKVRLLSVGYSEDLFRDLESLVDELLREEVPVNT